jgi:2-dehydro-3-deoxyphosphogluconate aldolase/(4S)-4-hydroxy-2-oxoglutarate aldolase
VSASSWFDTAFEGQRVMVILRGRPPAKTVELCHLAWDLGVTQVEVPVQSPDAVPSLRAAVAAGAERGHGVGAGTVTTVDQLAELAGIGVSFTVAPGLDDDVVRWSVEHGLPHLPGVSTPSEIQRAVRHGLDWVKAFPASVLGTGWFAAMRGPFPALKTVATGGMTVATVAEYREAGARVVSLGSALEDPAQVEELARLLG